MYSLPTRVLPSDTSSSFSWRTLESVASRPGSPMLAEVVDMASVFARCSTSRTVESATSSVVSFVVAKVPLRRNWSMSRTWDSMRMICAASTGSSEMVRTRRPVEASAAARAMDVIRPRRPEARFF